MKNIFARWNCIYKSVYCIASYCLLSDYAFAQTITTIAGGHGLGYSGDNGAATAAQISKPQDVYIDRNNNIYIADFSNNAIRKINGITGIITTIAGGNGAGFSGDGGLVDTAHFCNVTSMCKDSAGNLYISDGFNQRIRKIDASTGIVTTIAGSGPYGSAGVGSYSGDGGLATNATLWVPIGITFDRNGDLLIADSYNNRLRKVDMTRGIITTVAGSGPSGLPGTGYYSGDGGPATAAHLSNPAYVTVDKSNNIIFDDEMNHRVRKVDVATGIISTIAGNGVQGNTGDGGPATSAELNNPSGVCFDANGNLYIAGGYDYSIRRVDAGTGIICTVAGTGVSGYSGNGGPALNAQFNNPNSVKLDTAGNLIVADYFNYALRKITGTITSCTSPEIAPSMCTACYGLGPEMVTNGDFSRGNIGFSTDYQYIANTHTILPVDYFTITNNAQATGSSCCWRAGGGHNTGSDPYFVMNGALFAPNRIWYNTYTVTPNTQYFFSMWVNNLVYNNYPAYDPIMQLSINGINVSPPDTLVEDTDKWVNICGVWNSGSSTTANIVLNDWSAQSIGNDLGLDDISFRAITGVYIPPVAIADLDSSYCVNGQTIQLQATPAGGIFSGNGVTGNSFNPSTLSPGGPYYIFYAYTDSSGCSASDTASVKVFALPIIAAIPTASTICRGDSAIVQLSGADSYSWLPFNGLHNDTTSVQTVNPNSTTIYTITGTRGNCSSTTTDTVTVNPLPSTGTIFAIPDSICSGTTAVLYDSGSSSNSIQWQSSAIQNIFTDINGADSAFYSSAFSQTLYFRVIVKDSLCTNTSGIFTLIVNPSPVPPVLSAGDSLICASDSTLISSSGSYTSYLWNDGDTRPYTYANSAGGYWVTVFDANGCSAVSEHQTISVLPVPSVSIILSGDTLSSYGSSTYQWYFNDTAIQGANSPVYIASQSGVYAVQITDSNGCIARSNDIHLTTGVNNLSSYAELRVYPNPATRILNIQYTGSGGDNPRYVIMNSIGQTVITGTLSTDEIKTLEFSNQSPGLYLLQLYLNKDVLSRKIVLK